MVNITINEKAISVKDGTTILQAARENSIIIPSLCYLKDINEVASCRACVVEIIGNDRLVTACNTVCMEGMDILTNSKRVIEARRNNVALILSQHDCHCPTCARNNNCSLQNLAGDMNLLDPIYEMKLPENDWNKSLPIIRTNSKCIQCLRCISICDKIQGMQVWDLLGTGSRATVGVREGRKLDEVNCTYCGQCITHCPVGALRERDDTMKLMAAIDNPDKIVVLQVAPAVRAAWGDGVGLPPEMATEKRMAAAFRALGVDYVFDTNFAADLTIMEEGSELIERLTDKSGKSKMPMFTSCCPGWVRFMKLEYPELTGNLSSAKSPQQMFGAVTKTYFAEKIGADPNKIFCVSVMPCTAKKYECSVSELNDAGAGADVDIVLTTREIARLMRVKGINVFTLPEEEFDSPLGTGTGAAVIFGATGGVMEAALRTAYFVLEGMNPDPDAFDIVRGLDGRKEVTVSITGKTVSACVASGLINARAVMEDIVSGRAKYDFVEIMACPGGCAGGGGQPITDGCELAGERGARLYDLDVKNKLRFSHENPSVQQIYAEFFEKPLSHNSHKLLHTDQSQWSL
jgi:NADP-reducing hydrogenase subunit HndD